MTAVDFTLRPYCSADEDAAIDLWRRTWQHHYPHIDFTARLAWWRERWRDELVPGAAVVVAIAEDHMAGFITVERDTGYVDQVVVAPEAWGGGLGAMLLTAARRISPASLHLKVNADNARAIRFYEKQGFVDVGETANETSGAPVRKMAWRPTGA